MNIMIEIGLGLMAVSLLIAFVGLGNVILNPDFDKNNEKLLFSCIVAAASGMVCSIAGMVWR